MSNWFQMARNIVPGLSPLVEMILRSQCMIFIYVIYILFIYICYLFIYVIYLYMLFIYIYYLLIYVIYLYMLSIYICYLFIYVIYLYMSFIYIYLLFIYICFLFIYVIYIYTSTVCFSHEIPPTLDLEYRLKRNMNFACESLDMHKLGSYTDILNHISCIYIKCRYGMIP